MAAWASEGRGQSKDQGMMGTSGLVPGCVGSGRNHWLALQKGATKRCVPPVSPCRAEAAGPCASACSLCEVLARCRGHPNRRAAKTARCAAYLGLVDELKRCGVACAHCTLPTAWAVLNMASDAIGR